MAYQSKYRGDQIEQKLDLLDISQPLSKVTGKLTELESEVYSESEGKASPVDRIDGKYINKDGEFIDGSIYRIYKYDVTKGEKYHITFPNVGGTISYLYAVYAATGEVLDRGPLINAAMDVFVTIPTGGVKLACVEWINYNVGATMKVEKLSKAEYERERNSQFAVTLSNDGQLSVYRKYSDSKDFMLRMARHGANNLFQIYAHGYIDNNKSHISVSEPSKVIYSNSDWIGPYVMVATNREGGYKGFTGGCHGYNGDQTGSATARTESVSILVDNRALTEGTTIYGNEIKVVVTNYIQGGNTKKEDGSGVEILKELVTYRFISDKVEVSVEITALEDLSIQTYYGMQINRFSSSVEFVGDALIKETFNGQNKSKDAALSQMVLGDADEHYCIANLNNAGLGNKEHANINYYAFTSGTKGYYSLVDSGNPLSLKAEENVYWCGFYQFTDTPNVLGVIRTKAEESEEDKPKSDFMLESAVEQSEYHKMLANALLDVKIKGISSERKIVISRFSIVSYEGYYMTIKLADITDGTIKPLASFIERFATLEGIVTIPANPVDDENVYNAYITIDASKIKEGYFNAWDLTEVGEDTYAKYGIIRCCVKEDYDTALTGTNFGERLKKSIRKIAIHNLDRTRNYILKRFSYNRENGLLSLNICTDENIGAGYSLQTTILNPQGIQRVYSDTKQSYIDIDFSVANSQYTQAFILDTLTDGYDVKVDEFGLCDTITGEETIELTYEGEPMKLLDCGKVSKLFYMACGNKVFSTPTISKSSYRATDIDKSLSLIYDFPSKKSDRYYIEGINALRELNNGELLINVRIVNYAVEGSANYQRYSEFYRWDNEDMHFLFEGSWAYFGFDDGMTKRGGYWTNIWDFDEYEDLIFLSERCDQGTGGRAWMSKDGGKSWYVIFNAFTSTNSNAYSVVQPSGWDNTYPNTPDFSRPVGGVSNKGSNFHIHGITYDHYRDQVIIVSGDATWEKGSYSAIWILKNPTSCPILEGGAANSNAPQMLKCNWTRIGLFNDENNIGQNMQFVNSVVFKDVISFGTDNGGRGINGVVNNTFPQNIVATNLKVVYPLNSDTENAITHCASGVLKLKNRPVLWVFHREGTGFNANSSDQRASILASYDGITWKRVWVDDTLDGERKSEVSWGATLIGNYHEMWLRYKGANNDENRIRRMIML